MKGKAIFMYELTGLKKRIIGSIQDKAATPLRIDQEANDAILHVSAHPQSYRILFVEHNDYMNIVVRYDPNPKGIGYLAISDAQDKDIGQIAQGILNYINPTKNDSESGEMIKDGSIIKKEDYHG